MNSAALQERFPEVYREFFARCEVVASAPSSFRWAGEYAAPYGEVAVRQNLPLRAYVGFEPIDREGMELGNRLHLIPSQQRFEAKVRGAQRGAAALKLLSEEAAKRGWRGGYRVHSLSEVPSGSGLASSASFSAALATAFRVVSGQLTLAEVERWASAPVASLTEPGSAFDTTFRLGWKFECIYHANASSGSGVFTALASNPHPTVYATEKRSGDSAQHTTTRLPLDVGDDFGVIDRVAYWGFRLHELFGFARYRQWPVDFGLLFSGEGSSSELRISDTRDTVQRIRALSRIVDPMLATRIQPRSGQLPEFMKKGGPGYPTVEWWEVYLRALGVAGLETLGALVELLGRGFTRTGLSTLLRSVNLSDSLFRTVDEPSPAVEHLSERLLRYGRDSGIPVATKENGSGRGGDVLFVAPLYALEHRIDRLVRLLQRELGPHVNLDYASWLDGFEERGAVVEQHLGQKRSARFLPQGSVLVRSWSAGGSRTAVFSADRMESVRRRFDLFLDPAERRIYVRGRALTSEELNSSKVTIAVLRVLLENIGKSLPGRSLPATGYMDRTSLQGKITGPLAEAFKQRTGKRLPLTVSGGVASDFTVRLATDGLTVGMVEKVL